MRSSSRLRRRYAISLGLETPQADINDRHVIADVNVIAHTCRIVPEQITTPDGSLYCTGNERISRDSRSPVSGEANFFCDITRQTSRGNL
ncbi:hypothetical protein [Vineibacter terrae]|uniref:hypothetical protein n=1 Tax=Vineibacter terrae TaxID=2586908 RepID=UPI002E303FEC|nr:hypothetical protein [Vineibacter terrae]